MTSSDLSNKCRTCLSDSNVYHQLLDYVEENYKILEMLDSIVPQIDIKTSSQFSTLVCATCVDKLLTGYKFQQLCIETNIRLHDLLGLSLFETEPKLVTILDPLTEEPSFKMEEIEKEEIGSEIQTGENLDALGSYNEDDKGGGGAESDTDSSNEKLSSLKEKSLKMEILEKPPKLKNCKRNFPCSQCAKVFSSINRLNQHTTKHERIPDFVCKICNTSFTRKKTFNAHMLTHVNVDVSTKYSELNETIELIDSKEFNDEHKHQENKNYEETEECKESKKLLTFQCPHCPKVFKKKASLSVHCKVHKKKDFISINKNVKQSENEDALSSNNKGKENLNKSKVNVKDEIFDESMDNVDKDKADADWVNDDYEESDDNTEKELFAKTQAKETKKAIDFIDTSAGEIEKPKSSNKRKGKFPCDICGKIFDRPYRLKRHSSVHSSSRPYECSICKYRFATVSILKAHLLMHEKMTGLFRNSQTRPEGFQCPDCPRRFEKMASLSAHRQSHKRDAPETNYPCTVCQTNFMSVKSLTEHITNEHPEVEKHKCDQCDKTFVLHAHLVEHLNRYKGNRSLVCVICEKEFDYTTTLIEHMRTHTGESAYLCPQCGKTFSNFSSFRQHMERHMGLKKYQCPECPSRFNCRSDLIKHASTHSNDKPYACDICGSRFTRSYSLGKHKLLHTGERPFKCDQCNMTFVTASHLRRHTRTHTGEKPYKCKYCERTYASSGDLTKHLRTHVGKNTYICDQCPMAFKYQAELRHHQSQHYKMSQKEQSQKIPEETQKIIVVETNLRN